jgi:N-acetylglucosaminyl-diphospho-decaprenol L-rhamnosyltransferase
MRKTEIALSVIIVNYNSGIFAVDCIRSLLKQEGLALEIIVVDNASNDNSVALLQKTFNESIVLIESKSNLGFGKANNLGVSHAKGENLLLLNPDTVLNLPLDLQNLVCFLDAHPEMGMVGPQIEEPRKSKHVLPRYRYPGSKNLNHTYALQKLPGEIAWILGACMLIKHSVYDEISGFDPDYFLYGEDADICLRLRKHGYQIGYCDSVKITHISGASEIGSDSLDMWLRKKRGIFLFYLKHYDHRDVMRLAVRESRKASLYLSAYWITSLYRDKNIVQDNLNRYRATKIAATEVICQLSN